MSALSFYQYYCIINYLYYLISYFLWFYYSWYFYYISCAFSSGFGWESSFHACVRACLDVVTCGSSVCFLVALSWFIYFLIL